MGSLHKNLIHDSTGLTLVENLISLLLLATVAVSIAPVFVSSGKVAKGSNIREVCQRIVNAKIAKYRSMTQADLVARYAAYRNNSFTDGTYGGGTSWNRLCGYHPTQTFSTSFPYTAPAATAAPDAGIRANIRAFANPPAGQNYGTAPALGIRECVGLTNDPSADFIPGPAEQNETYLNGQCGFNGTTHSRIADRDASTLMPGLKMYASMALVNPWGGTRAYTCPANFAVSGLNQSLEIVVSAVADYRAVGLSEVAGERDPSRLMCSARVTIPIVSNASTSQFRYYAHAGPFPDVITPNPTMSPWTIRKLTNGIRGSADTAVYSAVSNAMNNWRPRTNGDQGGYVTQFGISPSGTRAFFVKSYELGNGCGVNDCKTSYYCAFDSLPDGETTSTATYQCFRLPRIDGNQIEFVMHDYQNGKMWGVTGRYMHPNRNPVSGSGGTSQDITTALMVADCYSASTSADTLESRLFTFTGCNSNPAVPVLHVVDGSELNNVEVTTTTERASRQMDLEYMKESPDTMLGTTPTNSVMSVLNHLQSRSLRDIDTMFHSDGLLYKIMPDRDCVSTAITGVRYACTRYAFARLFFSPDALSAYAVMRYPHDPTQYNTPNSQGVTCPNSSIYAPIDQMIKVVKLERPNAAGATDPKGICPNVVSTFTVTGSTMRYILISF